MGKTFKILNYGHVKGEGCRKESDNVLSISKCDDKTIEMNVGKMYEIRKTMGASEFIDFMIKEYKKVGITINKEKLVSC